MDLVFDNGKWSPVLNEKEKGLFMDYINQVMFSGVTNDDLRRVVLLQDYLRKGKNVLKLKNGVDISFLYETSIFSPLGMEEEENTKPCVSYRTIKEVMDMLKKENDSSLLGSLFYQLLWKLSFTSIIDRVRSAYPDNQYSLSIMKMIAEIRVVDTLWIGFHDIASLSSRLYPYNIVKIADFLNRSEFRKGVGVDNYRYYLGIMYLLDKGTLIGYVFDYMYEGVFNTTKGFSELLRTVYSEMKKHSDAPKELIVEAKKYLDLRSNLVSHRYDQYEFKELLVSAAKTYSYLDTQNSSEMNQLYEELADVFEDTIVELKEIFYTKPVEVDYRPYLFKGKMGYSNSGVLLGSFQPDREMIRAIKEKFRLEKSDKGPVMNFSAPLSSIGKKYLVPRTGNIGASFHYIIDVSGSVFSSIVRAYNGSMSAVVDYELLTVDAIRNALRSFTIKEALTVFGDKPYVLGNYYSLSSYLIERMAIQMSHSKSANGMMGRTNIADTMAVVRSYNKSMYGGRWINLIFTDGDANTTDFYEEPVSGIVTELMHSQGNDQLFLLVGFNEDTSVFKQIFGEYYFDAYKYFNLPRREYLDRIVKEVTRHLGKMISEGVALYEV